LLAEFDLESRCEICESASWLGLGMIRWQAKTNINGADATWKKLLGTIPDYPHRNQVQMLIAKAEHT
jgi:hypothetical protein